MDFDFDRRRRVVRSPRLVFGRAGCRVEENHRRRSWEARAHVLPTVAYRACCACGLDDGETPVSSSVNAEYWQDQTIKESPPQGCNQPRLPGGRTTRKIQASSTTIAKPPSVQKLRV